MTEEEYHQQEQDLHQKINNVLPGSLEEQELLKELEVLAAVYAAMQESAQKEQGLLKQLEDLEAKYAAERRKARVWRNSGLLVGMVSLLLVVGGVWGPGIIQIFTPGPTPTPTATLPPTPTMTLTLMPTATSTMKPPTPTPVPTPTTSPVTLLRSESETFSRDEITALVQTKGFYEKERNRNGNFPNDFKQQTLNGDKVVIDQASGLMWQQGGSSNAMRWQNAQDYVDQRNRDQYTGFSDWRLPTIEELASLLEPEKQSNDLYINPIFDAEQRWCWSADKYSGSSSAAWLVDFRGGSVYWNNLNNDNYVRAVRSMRN